MKRSTVWTIILLVIGVICLEVEVNVIKTDYIRMVYDVVDHYSDFDPQRVQIPSAMFADFPYYINNPLELIPTFRVNLNLTKEDEELWESNKILRMCL